MEDNAVTPAHTTRNCAREVSGFVVKGRECKRESLSEFGVSPRGAEYLSDFNSIDGATAQLIDTELNSLTHPSSRPCSDWW